jgi:hypothetical protein
MFDTDRYHNDGIWIESDVHQKEDDMPRTRRSNPGDSLWLSPSQQRAWVTYMRVQLRMNYEINRQLQRDSGLSLADYHRGQARPCRLGTYLGLWRIA